MSHDSAAGRVDLIVLSPHVTIPNLCQALINTASPSNLPTFCPSSAKLLLHHVQFRSIVLVLCWLPDASRSPSPCKRSRALSKLCGEESNVIRVAIGDSITSVCMLDISVTCASDLCASCRVQHFSPVAQSLWNNAHFGTLRDLKYLEKYPIRYDPCVVPSSPSNSPADAGDAYTLFSKPDPAFYTSADYVQAYHSKRTTPTAVAEYLLSLIRSPPHSFAFVEINDARTLAAAKASTERYAQGRALGPLDGVPIVVKDQVEIQGYKLTFGSARVFSDENSETAWVVQKLEEAGVIVIGKTNMHELASGAYASYILTRSVSDGTS